MEREQNYLGTVFAEYQASPAWSGRVLLGGQSRRYESENPGPSGTQVTLVRNQRGVLDWQNTHAPTGSAHRLTAGLTAEGNHTRNTGFGNINERQNLLAFFAEEEWTPAPNLHLTAGLRSDDHDTFGHATTGRATAAWRPAPGRVKLRASYGTAFRSPGFLDLYGQSSFYVGNPELKAEKARGWDAGADFYLPQGDGTLSVTWFDTRFRDLIVFDFGVFPGTTANVDRARACGVEVSARGRVAGVFECRLGYTFLEADNLTTGERLLRRPRNSASVDGWHDFGGGISVGAGLVWVAGRRDVHAATFATIDAEDYTVVRLYAAWTVTQRVTLKARIENLFDERYEEVHGYPALGRGFFAGVESRF
ncbi:MAG: hypothetical protein A3G75_09530 [Verrucomicrobia bacterium RIFCSPLOWO2_12_FULL_64_8]|nr:MAG: hypothetical protein A3G75_09530 [Verrucomicrobia bacterium RIFCSPLOWO2_12_FULL_64_8]